MIIYIDVRSLLFLSLIPPGISKRTCYITNSDWYLKCIHFIKQSKKEEYIRTGTIWKKKIENIKKLQSKYPIGFEVTVQTLNVGYLDEIQIYLKENFNIMSPLSNILVVPNYFAVDCLPNAIKRDYQNKNQRYISEDILSLLKLTIPVDNNIFIEGMNFLKLCDKRNKTNLLNEYPEFESFY